MKIELKVPIIIPIIIANEKLRMLSPPRTKIDTSTINVDTDVLIVRERVWLIESLKIFWISAFARLCLCLPKFSRIRS